MKKIISALFILFAFTIKAQINVEIQNIDKNSGQIFIALYNSDDTYMDQDKAFKTAIVKVENNKVSYSFENIPEGEYAIALFQDLNNDEKLNTNFVGIPKEPYGFSNNARGVFSNPSYDETKFDFENKILLNITIK